MSVGENVKDGLGGVPAPTVTTCDVEFDAPGSLVTVSVTV
jgi:hypothetical protein